MTPSWRHLESALTDVVLNELQVSPEDAALHRVCLDHQLDYTKAVRTHIQQPGTAINTRTKALWYCMYYLPMHIDAYYQVLTSAAASLANLLNSVDKVIFVDFGCGHMT